MSKPDDIPQDAWDAAEKVHMLPHFKFSSWRYVLSTDIARAIVAAKAEEREACAKLAEEFAGQFPEFPEFDEQHNCAIYIASVIRGEAHVSTARKSEIEA